MSQNKRESWFLFTELKQSEALSPLMNPAHRRFAGADKLSAVLRQTSGYLRCALFFTEICRGSLLLTLFSYLRAEF